MKKVLIIFTSALMIVLPFLNPTRSAKAQQDPPRWDCCFHIYSVGSNLGWASSLLNYTYVRTRLEPADQTIFDNLFRAGQHIEAAYKTCSAMNPAWKDWANRQRFLSEQINAIRQRPDSVIRMQVAGNIRSSYQWGQALRVRIFNEQAYEHDTCAEKYFRLGFLLGYAHQTLGIAEERMQYGRNDWSAPVSDARQYLQNALQVLTEYFGLAGCSEIRDLNLQARITNLMQADSRQLRAINVEMLSVWQALQQRLSQRCDLGTTPTPGGGSIVGRWTLRLGGQGGPIGSPNENVVRNVGELIITLSNGRYSGQIRVEGLPWENLLDVTFSSGVLSFTRPPTYYHQIYRATLSGNNRLEGRFANVRDQSQAYKWWGEKID